MGWLAVSVLSIIVLLAQETGSKPQESAPPRTDPESFYSGVIDRLEAERVVVSRTILGKPAEKRTFLVNGETKVEGKMKTRSRITVRYISNDEGDVALSILVRDNERQPKRK